MISERDTIKIVMDRYLRAGASRDERATFIRKQRRLLRKEHKQSFSEGFVNRLGIIHGNAISLGSNWFKVQATGKCYHVVRDGDTFKVDMTRQSKVSVIAPVFKDMRDRHSKKVFKQTHITINCIVCGEERIIKNCDTFQVVRCTRCQREYKRVKRLAQYYEQRKGR